MVGTQSQWDRSIIVIIQHPIFQFVQNTMICDGGIKNDGWNANILHEEESILRGKANLLDGFSLRHISGPAPIGIATDYAKFLGDGVYKFVIAF